MGCRGLDELLVGGGGGGQGVDGGGGGGGASTVTVAVQVHDDHAGGENLQHTKGKGEGGSMEVGDAVGRVNGLARKILPRQ